MEVRAAELANRLAAVEREREEIVTALQDIEHEQQACMTEKAEGLDQAPATAVVTADSPKASKIALFKSLFRGRPDVFPRRWENPRAGKSGYSPACRNEWVRGTCGKPKVRCSECPHQAFPPLSDDVIRSHLLGRDVSAPSGNQRIKGFCVAKPTQKPRWMNAGATGLDGAAMEISPRTLDVPADHRGRTGAV